jgi:hypothetical protein
MRFFLTLLFVFALCTPTEAQQSAKVSTIGFLARIIHGFLKSAEKLLWIAKHLQSEYQMLNFVQAATTDRRDL